MSKNKPVHTSSDAAADDDDNADEEAIDAAADTTLPPPPRTFCTRVLMHISASDRALGCHRRTVRSELAVAISELSRLMRI
jgi:hypothetical protein